MGRRELETDIASGSAPPPDRALSTVDPIEARIAGVYAELTSQERRAAETILEHLDDLASYSSAELSELSGVSRPTLSRLYRRLGYESFAQMRSEARRDRGIPLGVNNGIDASLAQETRNLTQLARLADGRLQASVRSMMGAASLVIIGERNSYPVALHLRQQLVQLRRGSYLLPLPGQTFGEDLVGVGPGDTVVLVGLRRRTSGFGRLLRYCVALRADVVLIADNSARHYEQDVTHFLPCSLDSSGPFSSYASAMALVAMIANEASAIVGAQGQRRVGLIAASYQDLDEIENS
ncbi:DNA-binding transcriptional regulator, MurR/RpiR family, contains HTH and SIS domains [Propionibacterium cyclohexanicum]|uniref:DNA-binding transcriptional regulator, MurR/RpiR family, contains HTH and SIS domains n=1 Tax=Propionibacterium cyclohexanicum TaxID=64702 RepID=A0A1H9SMI8_9ACTN|nr:MurR/RpiR family transcriptional regulator [Propionibacterium cyclohexanicum]SER86098.1 DNA-binding transcriptional regulator, MurR/RpiR family, contains HTH and SIS domains [Propionibacterium cyclohexanicum]